MSIAGYDASANDSNPIDSIEEIVTIHEWPFDRSGDDELSFCVAGTWCDYHMCFTYLPDEGGLQFACAVDMRVEARKRPDVYELINMINECMWLGHYELWSEEGVPMFRYTGLVSAGLGPTSEQLEKLIEVAVTESERFYPAFQFVVWGGKTPTDAMSASMLETVGEA